MQAVEDVAACRARTRGLRLDNRSEATYRQADYKPATRVVHCCSYGRNGSVLGLVKRFDAAQQSSDLPIPFLTVRQGERSRATFSGSEGR